MRSALPAAMFALLMATRSYPAVEDPTDVDRNLAECIDQYNNSDFKAEDSGFKHNPWIFHLGGDLLATGTDGARPITEGPGEGGRIDVDPPVIGLPIDAGHTVTGFSFGISAMASWWRHARRDWTIEVRSGFARRQFAIVLDKATQKCRHRRTDLVLDFLRWRFGNFTEPAKSRRGTWRFMNFSDLTESSHRNTFVTSIAPATLTLRRMLPDRGCSGTVSVDVRLAPTLQGGVRIAGEQYVGPMAISVSFAGYVPHWTGVVAVGFGFRFELGGGP